MFPDELEAAFAECPVVYYAHGLCEPHGPQNAIGLDGLKAHAICCRAAHEHGGIVAPLTLWHCHESGGYAHWSRRAVGEVARKWLTAVPPWVHFKQVLYEIRAAEMVGFHAGILFTGHYGPNWEDLKTLVELVQPHVAIRLYGLPESEANVPGFDGDGAPGDHAGKVETSLLWALMPECVDVSRIPPPDAPGTHMAMGANARESSRRIGQRMVADEVRWLGNKARELLAEYDRLQPGQRGLTSFAETEALWRDAIEPKLPEFRTMQDSWGWGDEKPLPEDSVWYANWRIEPVAGRTRPRA
jgi:creatinine amidohydrolase